MNKTHTRLVQMKGKWQ